MRLAMLLIPLAVGCGGAAAQATTPVAPSIHAVDFANFTYDIEGAPPVTVEDGRATYPTEGETSATLSVGEPSFGDLTGDAAEEAALVLTTETGGTGRFDHVRVYTIGDDGPALLGTVPGGDRADGGIASVRVEAGELVVERAQGDAACCPQEIRTERWRWDGTAFVEDEARRTSRPVG